ncbi:MAG: ribbon-helix-helix protein, CopG family [Acidobacteriota bacterium]
MAIAMVKVTFTLDEATVERLAQAAARRSIPKSQAVREAIEDYHAKAGRRSEPDRQRMLKVLTELMAEPPTRSQAEVDRELAEIRRARQQGGRRHPVD